MKNKKIIITSIIIAVLVLTIGITYSIFTTSKTSKNSSLVVGDIYMHYNETTNSINIKDMMPTSTIKVNTDAESVAKCVEYLKTTYGDTWNYLRSSDDVLESSSNKNETAIVKQMESSTNTVGTYSEYCSCKRMTYTVEPVPGNSKNKETIVKPMMTSEPSTTSIGTIYILSDLENGILTADDKKYFEDNGIIEDNILELPYFEFTVDGKNTTTNKDVWYEVILSKGDNLEGKTRIKDNLLKFRLTETKDNKETIVVDNKSYDDLINKRIWVDTINRNTISEVVHTYRLYMWISNDTVIGNVNQDYTMEEWKNIFASIKVNVSGDFWDLQSTINLPLPIALSGDGLVAVNTNGERANKGDTIREYRYSGSVADNYISFNNELWRIVGLFTETTGDGKEEQLMKIVKSEELTNLPTSFKASNTYQGTTTETTYTFGSSDGTKAYWNNPDSTYSGNRNDWTRSGVMHYLNDIYLPTIETKYANMVENVVYQLGGSDVNSTPAKSYREERNTTTTWAGKVGLLYASDQAYARSSTGTGWESNFEDDILSWFTPSTTNWLLSSWNNGYYRVMNVYSSGKISYYIVSGQFALRPCLYLKSDTEIILGSGTIDDPYILNVL